MGGVGVKSFIKNLLDFNTVESEYIFSTNQKDQKTNIDINKSDLISRDLSWMKFNERVLDQVSKPGLNIFERLKFLAISASNLDEFMSVRLGSLYNYIDYDKERTDYSGLREKPFRKVLLNSIKKFIDQRNSIFREFLTPQFEESGFKILRYNNLSEQQIEEINQYFDETVYPMLTPMVCDHTHAFPVLLPKSLLFGVISLDHQTTLFPENEENKKLSFVQIPSNIPQFYEFESDDIIEFLPIEEIVKSNIGKLYKNVTIESVDLFRIIRNADFTLDENDDADSDFVDEVKEKIRSRQAGRIISLIVENTPNKYLLDILKKKWEIDKYNIHINNELMDYTRLWQIIKNPEFSNQLPTNPLTINPLNLNKEIEIFDAIKENDILLHHPYNNFDPVLHLLEKASEDPNVLSIKLTIYRLAKNSRITTALLRAAENGKHVSALFEIKARFDEENNIREAEKLQKAGCFVIYGIGWLKTHTKLMLIVRKEGTKVVQYAHMASGNYNEETAKLYTDVGLLTSNQDYTQDIAEFFNVITGHSQPEGYKNLITAPKFLRQALIEKIRKEADNQQKGLPAGICLKVNSLEDKEVIEELYFASQAGVKIELIVRGICCLRPQRSGLSDNIKVRSIVGNLLEHARIFYFHNEGDPIIYGGSADIMVRSFDKRIESIFEFINPIVKQQLIHILKVNLKDNCNSFELLENGEYLKVQKSEPEINIHKYFFKKENQNIKAEKLF